MKKTFRILLLLAVAAVGARAADLPPINASQTGLSLPGKLIWADLFTQNPAGETQFYKQLFGWSSSNVSRPGGNNYILLSNRDQPVAGIVFRAAPKGNTGQGRWINYVSVSNMSQSLAAAEGRGGKIVHPAKNLSNRGIQVILTDSQGSYLGLIQSSSGDPDDTEPTVGSWAWAHLSARDPSSASQFYQAVVGYDYAPDNREGRNDVFLLNSRGFARASVGPIPNHPEAYPDWLGFVRVANIDQTLAAAVALGAHVLLAPKSTETGTRIAILADPSDVAIGLVELSTSTALEEPKS